MSRQTQDSACVVWRHCVGAGRFSALGATASAQGRQALPLVCFELLTLAFAMVAGRIERMTGTSTAVEPDAHMVVSTVPQALSGGKDMPDTSLTTFSCHLGRGKSISCAGRA